MIPYVNHMIIQDNDTINYFKIVYNFGFNGLILPYAAHKK